MLFYSVFPGAIPLAALQLRSEEGVLASVRASGSHDGCTQATLRQESTPYPVNNVARFANRIPGYLASSAADLCASRVTSCSIKPNNARSIEEKEWLLKTETNEHAVYIVWQLKKETDEYKATNFMEEVHACRLISYVHYTYPRRLCAS